METTYFWVNNIENDTQQNICKNTIIFEKEYLLLDTNNPLLFLFNK